jgi:predicted DNA-binding transcriptional regulator AlpA
VSERLLTAREVAETLAVSTGALLRWTRAGLVPAIKLPSGAVRYRPDAIAAWLSECETGAAEPGVSATEASRARSEPYANLHLRPSATGSSTATPRHGNQEEHDG